MQAISSRGNFYSQLSFSKNVEITAAMGNLCFSADEDHM